MSWLFSGFEPFNGESHNPSLILAQTLSRQLAADCVILPVSYDRSWQTLKSHLEKGKYKGLIAMGQAAGRTKVGLERVALNLQDAEMPDCDGQVRIEKEIEKGGPDAIMNSLPLREIVANLKERIGPIEISSSAGTYVCNSLYYQIFRWLEQNPAKLEWQMFIHLPYLPEQVFGKPDSTPFLSQNVMEQAIIETFQTVRGITK